MRQIRVAIVDDHSVVRQGIACILQGQMDLKVVAEAENGLFAVGVQIVSKLHCA
jgi:two-component system response regulator NreC